MQRAVNASPSRAAEVQVLPPRPILFRQSVGSDVSQWYWEERSATLRAGSIFVRTWRNSRRAGPRSRRAQAHEGATPSARTTFRGVVGTVDTVVLNPAGPSGPCRCNPGRRDQSCGRAWNVDRAVSKTAAPTRRVGVQVAPAAPIFDGWWNVYTRVSETRGRKPVQVRVLFRRPISRFVL